MALKPVIYGGIKSDRPLIRESFWQRGCDDARAGRPFNPPCAAYTKQHMGYTNGFRAGQVKIAPAPTRRVAVESMALPPDLIDFLRSLTRSRAILVNAPSAAYRAQELLDAHGAPSGSRVDDGGER